MELRDVMKKPVVIDKNITLFEVAKIMSQKKINSLIIVRNDKPIGIITEEDLVENFGRNIKVSEVMSRELIVLKEKSKAEDAIQIMKSNRIGVLPIVDSKGFLVGVVNAKDLLREVCETSDFVFD